MKALSAEGRSCFKCNYETDDPIEQCPQCGQRLRTARSIRRLGWVLVFLGGFLVVFMGAITVAVLRFIAAAQAPDAQVHFNGSPEMLLFIYGIFGFVILFGVVAMAGGVWQIKYGKRNKKLAYVVLAMGLLFLVIGWVFRFSR
jgi:uncharacterized paraquat-inducible protein A